MKKDIYRAASEKFLGDVKDEIKYKYRSQQRFAETIPISRKVLIRVLKNIEDLSVYWMEIFKTNLGLDFIDYLKREKD